MSNNQKPKESGHSIVDDLILGVCLLVAIVLTMVVLAAIVTTNGLPTLIF